MLSFYHCCSYCHCSTGSYSHSVVLSKPASCSPALFSIPVKRHKDAYQSVIVAYGTAVVRLQCVSGCGKLRLRYGESTCAVSKAHVWLEYGKSTVNYSNGTETFFLRLLYAFKSNLSFSVL